MYSLFEPDAKRLFSLTQVSLAQPVADDDTPRNVSSRQGGEETGPDGRAGWSFAYVRLIISLRWHWIRWIANEATNRRTKGEKEKKEATNL